MITTGDLSFVIIWLALVLFLYISLVPFLRSHFSKVFVPLSFSISILLFTLLSYWLVFFHLPVQFTLFPFVIGIGYTWYQEYRKGGVRHLINSYSFLTSEWRYYSLFFVVFLAQLTLRLYNSDICSAEKFMDHGLIASMMRMPVIPPLDPWFSGGDLSVYYYLGHWMFAAMGLTSSVPSSVLFTLALPTLAALSAVNLYGVGHLLLPRLRLLSVLLFFLVNPAFVQLAIYSTEWNKLLLNSTRVIDGTINEYPFFSFIFGDVHAHVMDFFPQTTLILLTTLTITSWKMMQPVSRLLLILSTGLVLGSIPPTNSWDVLVYAPLILITGVILLLKPTSSIHPQSERRISLHSRFMDLLRKVREPVQGDSVTRHFSSSRGAILYLLLVPVLGILSYLPFYLALKVQGIRGIDFVTSPSSPLQFLLVNGWFVAILLLSLIPILRRYPWIFLIALPFLGTGYYTAAIPAVLLGAILLRREGVADILAGTALVILIFCEILYLQDSFGDQLFRMNTVFKFYISAWILFSCATAYMLGEMLRPLVSTSCWSSRIIEGVVPLILLLLLVVPTILTASHAAPDSPTIDGLNWLSSSHSDDFAAIHWLRTQKENLTLVEAVGLDYSYHSRISALTGIPALLGWPSHEFQWRNNTPLGWYAQRTTVVRTMYEDPTWCVKLMNMFHIDLLYVGPTEEETYNVTLPDTGLAPVYHHGAVTIYHVA